MANGCFSISPTASPGFASSSLAPNGPFARMSFIPTREISPGFPPARLPPSLQCEEALTLPPSPPGAADHCLFAKRFRKTADRHPYRKSYFLHPPYRSPVRTAHPEIRALGPDPLTSPSCFMMISPYRLRWQGPGGARLLLLCWIRRSSRAWEIPLKCEILYAMRFPPSLRRGSLCWHRQSINWPRPSWRWWRPRPPHLLFKANRIRIAFTTERGFLVRCVRCGSR